MKSKSLNIVSKFNRNEIPIIYKSLLESNKDSNSEIKHSIVDLSENRVYHLVFPKNYNGTSTDEIIKSSEIWDDNANNNNIPIGNNQEIKWIDVDWKNVNIEDIDDEMIPLNTLFDGLEVNCDRMCCGIEAFSFTTNQIQEAAAKLNLDLGNKIDEIIKNIELKKSIAVGLVSLNQNFEKTVFINLLKHIKKALNTQL